jgi:predicted transcriptional regulator
MSKTVEIDDDVLTAAEKLAEERHTTAGQVISDLTRQALARRLAIEQLPIRDGFRYLPKRGGVVTPELIERLADDEP